MALRTMTGMVSTVFRGSSPIYDEAEKITNNH